MTHLSFRMPEHIVEELTARLPDPWQGNTFGQTIFLSKYSRKKPDGTKERWHEVVRRCVEGSYSIQRDWCTRQRIPWSDKKALRSAIEMFERMYTFKFTPPGRGLWMMGTEFVHNVGSAALQNCAFVSTMPDLIRAAEFLMEASMLGVGVGFDTMAAGEYVVNSGQRNMEDHYTYTIPDSREGWVESVSIMLAHFFEEEPLPHFDYSEIRPYGEPIKGFGGTAAGPEPLMELHDALMDLFAGRDGEVITEGDVVDVMNLIGKCVVAGNVRRSAEIAIGQATEEFLHLKDYDLNGVARHPAAKGRAGHGWASNNSVFAQVGRTNYEQVADLIQRNGEPGLFWLDVSRQYGRLGDEPNGKDYRAQGTNPCGEQTLESFEMCNLVETYPSNHSSRADYLRTLKYAYLYAKSVTLLQTHWPETNAIMLRNRRIGVSPTGIFQFAEEHGIPVLLDWLRHGYDEIQDWDTVYSEWLCVRPSIKTTSVKPSGTLSKMVRSQFNGKWYAGITPGVHAPVARSWIQRIILSPDDSMFQALVNAGYRHEESLYTPGSYAVEVPVTGPPVRTQDEVSIWEKVALAAAIQREWADNSVSVTVDFDPETEGPQIANVLHLYDGQLKAVSFLPRQEEGSDGAYAQMPMDRQPREQVEAYAAQVGAVDFEEVYVNGSAAEGEHYCDTDACEVPVG